jgi:hypothetical protein
MKNYYYTRFNRNNVYRDIKINALCSAHTNQSKLYKSKLRIHNNIMIKKKFFSQCSGFLC